MIKLILDMLALDPWYGLDEDIEFAKGKYKLNTNYAQEYQRRKREKAWSGKSST